MSESLFPSEARDVVRVALPLPVDRLFDYAVPASLASEIEPGRRVRVTAGGRKHTGIVVERADVSEAGSVLRPVESSSAHYATRRWSRCVRWASP
jgi:primosomal protein N'